MAVVGAGPVGLALALHAADEMPSARISLFDAREVHQDVGRDPRTLALSLGSIQGLQRLGVWPMVNGGGVTPILEVHVSQQQPTLLWPQAQAPVVRITAREQHVPQLGAVLGYGDIVAPLHAAWLARAAEQPERLINRFGMAVRGLDHRGPQVQLEIDPAPSSAQNFDLVVVAEGGVFADQPPLRWPRGVSRNYRQTAWVGQVGIQGASAGVAYERFTPQGPAALLPLSCNAAGFARAALVWCVPSDDDPVSPLTPDQRLSLLNSIFHCDVGRIVEISPLKSFALGLNAVRCLVQAPPDPSCTPRIVRIGNAAQTLHPVAGQGLNLGLRDVEVLIHQLRRHGDLAQALRATERERAPDRWAIIGATDLLARSFTASLPSLATARGWGLGLLEQMPSMKTRVAQAMMFGWR